MVSGFSGEDMCQNIYVPEAYIIYTIYILKSPFPLSPFQHLYTVKNVREFPIPSRDVTTKLSLGGNNDIITELFLPGEVWFVTSRLETETHEPYFTVYKLEPCTCLAAVPDVSRNVAVFKFRGKLVAVKVAESHAVRHQLMTPQQQQESTAGMLATVGIPAATGTPGLSQVHKQE